MAQIPQEGKPEIASDVATLTVRHKVQIPKGCMAIITWPKENTVELVAELFEVGCIRLHLASEILPQIKAKREEIHAAGAPNRLELIGALDDKYRTVSLYIGEKGENSVRLDEERIRVYLRNYIDDLR